MFFFFLSFHRRMHVLRPDELAALLRDADQDEEGYEYGYDDDDNDDGGGGGGGEYQQQRNQQRKEEEDKENSFDDDDDGPGKSTKTTVGERRRLSFQPEEDVQDLEDADDINETRVLLETMKRHVRRWRTGFSLLTLCGTCSSRNCVKTRTTCTSYTGCSSDWTTLSSASKRC